MRLITDFNSTIVFVRQKQEVLIVLDDQSHSEDLAGDRSGQSTITPLINQSQGLLDPDVQPKPVTEEDNQTKDVLEGLNLSDSQSILPELPAEQKEKPTPAPLRSDTLNRHVYCIGVKVGTIFFLFLAVLAVWPFLITRERKMMS